MKMHGRCWAGVALTLICLPANTQLFAQGLIAHYPLNGDGADASGNGHNGVVVAATPTSNLLGQPGHALLFDGTNSFVAVPDSTDLRLATTDFTITTWFLEVERDAHFNDCIISKRGPTGPGKGRPGDGRGWIISIRGLRDGWSAGRVVYQVSGGEDPSAITTGTLSLNQWHHLAVVFHHDKSAVDFYVDGAWDSTSDEVPPPNPDSQPEMHIGNDSQLAYNNAYVFHGKISDVRIYDRALTAPDVAALYTNGLFIPATQLATATQPPTTNIQPMLRGIQFTGPALTHLYGGLTAGQQIIVESSSDLVHWTAIQTNIATSATLCVTNFVNPDSRAEFFRVSVR
jgi:hypothetical protein